MSDMYAHLNETFILDDIYKIKWGRLGHAAKPAVIFVQGTPFSSLEWLPIARASQKDYCVYLWDLPGFGASQETVNPIENFDLGLGTHADAFAALCKH